MKHTLLILLPLSLIAAGGLRAAEHSSEAARDLFYSSRESRAPEWLGIRTSILLKYKDSKNQVRMAEVSDLKPFRDGDRFRFRMQSNIDGYLYIFLRSSRGETQLLFPYDAASSGKIRRFQSRSVPERDWFQFDKRSGAETVYLILSPERLPDIDRLVNGDKRNVRESDLERWVGRASGGQSMLFDEDSLEDSGDVGATYYVEKPGDARDYLVRRFELTHNAGRSSRQGQ